MTNQDYTALADKVIGMLLHNNADMESNSHLAMDNWEWPTGVALYSLFKVFEKTGDSSYLRIITRWFDHQFTKHPPHRNVNTVAPVLAMTCVYSVTKEECYLPHIESWADWVMKDMPRTEYGGLQHMTVLNHHHQQLWDDTLFMAVLFLARAGKLLDRKDWVEEAKYQFLIHIKYLQDKVTGLFYHGWTFDRRHNFAEAFWARGNSWFTAGAVEFLEILEEPSDAIYQYVHAAWLDQIKELQKYQGINGLFNTLLDDEGSYYETSATAAIAYGIHKGLRLKLAHGELYEEMADKAIDAVIHKISEDGTVEGVSFGTGMGHSLQFYRDIAVRPTAYGQGLAFLMLTELI